MSEDHNDAARPAYAGAGARLREAREARGLSRADIAARTRIAERHLAEIEAGRFDALASRAYAVGFSRTFARAVGLDPDEIVLAVREETGMARSGADDAQSVVFEPGDPARGPSRSTAWLAALAAFVVVLAGFAVWRTYYLPAASLPPLVPDETAAPPAATASRAPAAPQGPVTLTATQPGVWIKVYDAAGVQLFQKELALGESYAVPADANGPMLWTGRPDALSVTVGGQAVAPLADRQVTIRDVPVSAAALLARGNPATAAASTAPPTGAPVPGATRAPAPRPRPVVRTERPRPVADATPEPVTPAGVAPAPASAAPAPASTDSE